MRVALLGDSICKSLQGLSKNILSMYDVRNFGVSGFKSSDLLHSVILRRAAEFDPSIVIVILSGNDITPGINIEEIITNISEITDYFRSKNITVRFCGMLYRRNPRGLNSITYKKICNSVNRRMRNICPCLTFFSGLGKEKLKYYLKSDGVHLNYEGKIVLLNKIKSTIENTMG